MPDVGARLVPPRIRRRASRPVSPLKLVIVSIAVSWTYALNVLAAVDLDLGAGNIACSLLAEEVDHVGHFVGCAETTHGDLFLDDLLGAGRQDRGVDLARGDSVHANATRSEVVRHFAGERRQRGLRGGVGGAREGMDAAAGDRG